MMLLTNRKQIITQLRNILSVIVANFSNLFSGIVVGFVIPKIFSIDGYGYYKTFTLYASYVGIFSMGIIDGIVLKYGGCNYDKLNQIEFRGYFACYTLIHLFLCVVLIAISFFVNDIEYCFLMLMIALYMIIANAIGYFQQISQVTLRIREYSIAKIIQSVMNIIAGIILVFLFWYTKSYVDYKLYLSLLIVILTVILTGYIIIYRDIIFGNFTPLLLSAKKIIGLSKLGLPLMFANICILLILSVDQQFINLLFSNSDYAIYSFSYNLLSLITMVTSAISFVIFPVFKRTSLNKLVDNYSNFVSLTLIFVFFVLLLYFPLCEFIKWFLPKYVDSLSIFRVILPGVAISTVVTVVMHNYYKTLDVNTIFFKKSFVIFLMSIIMNFIAFVLFKNIIALSIMSVIVLVFWYIQVEQYFVDMYHYSRTNNFVYLFLMMIAFYGVAFLNFGWWVLCIIYAILYVVITTIMQRKIINDTLSIFQ